MFGRKSKIRKAVERALARVDAEDDLADHAPIEALPAELRAEAFHAVAIALHRDERYAAAKVSLAPALALAPGDVDLHRLSAADVGNANTTTRHRTPTSSSRSRTRTTSACVPSCRASRSPTMPGSITT